LFGREGISVREAAIQSAGRSLREATVRYKAGIDPYLNVIGAQTTLLSNEQTAISFQEQQMVVRVQLIKALGSGWDAARLPEEKELGSARK
jgi:outer membrane protein TolC